MSEPLLQPLTPLQSIPYFLVPALLMAAGFYWLLPALLATSMNDYGAYSLALGLPMLLMLLGSLVLYGMEGHPLTWQALAGRFRLEPVTWKQLGICLGIFVASVLLNALAARLSAVLIEQGLVTVPAMPEIADQKRGFVVIEQAYGGSLKGQWSALVLTVVLLVLNVVGEEFWWRGLILPRQELGMGAAVIVVHGLSWTLFHGYKYWDLLNLVPMCIGLTAVVYLTKNTTTGLIFHLLGNGTVLVPMLVRVLGKS